MLSDAIFEVVEKDVISLSAFESPSPALCFAGFLPKYARCYSYAPSFSFVPLLSFIKDTAFRASVFLYHYHENLIATMDILLFAATAVGYRILAKGGKPSRTSTDGEISGARV